jgi:dihydrofolate reductase
MEAPDKWHLQFWHEEMGKYKYDELFASDALLLGRVTYEGFAAAWPSRTDEAGFADKMNGMPKYVVSTTLEELLEWNNSTLIDGDVAEAVAELKREVDGDILINGSAQLVQALMEHDLVDEYRLMVFPIVLGADKRLFGETSDAVALRLMDAKPAGETVILSNEPGAKDAGNA